MIDYVKILIKNPDIKRLRENPLLDFKRKVSDTTGLLSAKTVSRHHHCEIRIYDSGAVIFSGSMHKMYNSLTGVLAPNHKTVKEYRGFNGNQFYYHEIDFIRQHLIGVFHVLPESMIIQNIEYGLNLTTSFDPQNFIRWLLLFEMKTFEFQHNEFFAQSVHSQYILKIYNKGNQYDMALNTLRFEMKVTTMEHQGNEVGIRSMADISISSMGRAFNYLRIHLEKVLYYDSTIDKSCLTPTQSIKTKDYCNPRYWTGLTYKERSRNKKRLNTIIELYSQNLGLELLELLEQNWVQFDRLFENPKWVQFDSSSIVSNYALLPQRICPVTGLDISMQKPDSKMLSNTGLKHLEKKNPKAFEQLKRTLLTGSENKYEKSIYSMISKQIRNRKNSNHRNFQNKQLRIF